MLHTHRYTVPKTYNSTANGFDPVTDWALMVPIIKMGGPMPPRPRPLLAAAEQLPSVALLDIAKHRFLQELPPGPVLVLHHLILPLRHFRRQ